MLFRSFLGAIVAISANSGLAAAEIHWRDWSPSLFETAAKEHKLVLLNLHATWCHWCHVMDDTTYRDPKVAALIDQRYIPVQVDEDSHPDLTNRYINYGWPATIIFNAEGVEIVKRRGYVEPDVMQVVLRETFDDPQPNPNPTQNFPSSRAKGLTGALHDAILSSIVFFYDDDNGGWGTGKKYIDAGMLEFAIGKAIEGNRVFRQASEKTLHAGLALIDPVWGGVSQYSESVDWKSPHFEKILWSQTSNIRSYAYGYGAFGDADYRDAADRIMKYVDAFMTSPEGAFYVSQDADLSSDVTGHEYYQLADAERRKLGMPTIDRHIYANENGALISALVVLHAMTGDAAPLQKAIRAAHWLIGHRALPEAGGYAHGEPGLGGPFLADDLAVSRAMLDLYAATGDRAWLSHAKAGAGFILAHFPDKKGEGFFTAESDAAATLAPFKEADQNLEASRFFNLLFHYSRQDIFRDAAVSALRSAASREAIAHNAADAGYLLADDETKTPPLHLTVVGRKDDPAAQALFAAMLKVAPLYKLTEWQDPREGALPGSDVEYPELAKAAAFVCTANLCSAPAFSAEGLEKEIARTR